MVTIRGSCGLNLCFALSVAKVEAEVQGGSDCQSSAGTPALSVLLSMMGSSGVLMPLLGSKLEHCGSDLALENT